MTAGQTTTNPTCQWEHEIGAPHEGCAEFMSNPQQTFTCDNPATIRITYHDAFYIRVSGDPDGTTEILYCADHAEATRAAREADPDLTHIVEQPINGFIAPTPDLLGQVEPAAGEILPPRKGYRSTTEFYPHWGYIASAHASTVAVVAALTLAANGVPEQWWEPIVRVHCPRATALLAAREVTFTQMATGHGPIGITEQVAPVVNMELAGYMVFYMPDTAALIADTIGNLGAVPTFTDDIPNEDQPGEG